MRCTGTPPTTSSVTGLGPAGTPRRPNRPTTTWPSNCAGSSSPRDFGFMSHRSGAPGTPDSPDIHPAVEGSLKRLASTTSLVERRSRRQPAEGDRVADQIKHPAELAADRNQADRRTNGAE